MPPTAPVLTNNASATQTPGAPPDDSIWVRYSPHHEFPLSSVASVALHVLVGGLLVLGVIYAPKLGCLASKEAPVDIGAIEIVPGPNDVARAGGGGGAGGAGAGAPDEHVETGPEDKNVARPAELAELPVPQADNFDPLNLRKLTLPDGRHAVANANEAMSSLEKVSEAARAKIWKGVGGGGSGPGTGGGRDRGKDTGVGPGEGDGGRGKLTTQQKRVLRWRMTFDTRSGEDYARQLSALGAILAIPDPADPKQYLVIEDLKQRPAKGQVKDLGQIKRIFWTDDKPDSVASLSRALGFQPVPSHVVAFFPKSLEEKLLAMELKFRGRREDQIQETRFRVVPSGTTYEPRVESQH